MKGIVLTDSIRLFGFRSGFSFWFRWSFIDPVKMFVWLNITHKPYCLHHGYFGCSKECNHKKLYTKAEILARWKKDITEMDKVKVGPNGMCAFCGEFKGTVLIPDPNGGLGKWKVCVTCKKTIEALRKISFGEFMLEHTKSEDEKEYPRKVMNEAQEELDFIEAESFMPTFTLKIKKKDKGCSGR